MNHLIYFLLAVGLCFAVRINSTITPTNNTVIIRTDGREIWLPPFNKDIHAPVLMKGWSRLYTRGIFKLMEKNQSRLTFTENEISVTWFYMTGMTIQQISEWLSLPEKSVSRCKRTVMRKIGVRNNNEFIMWFLENRVAHLKDNREFRILGRRKFSLNKEV